jgi:hypothetical protein
MEAAGVQLGAAEGPLRPRVYQLELLELAKEQNVSELERLRAPRAFK